MSDAFRITKHLHYFVSVLCFQILEKIVKTSDVSGIYEQEDVLMQRSRVSVDVQMYVH